MKPEFFKKVLLFTAFAIMSLIPMRVSGQTGIVTGTIYDESGGTLPGVTIAIVGTTRGTTTDVNGKFSISANPGEVLQISFVGMISQNLAVGNQTKDVRIIMKTAVSEIAEVVVIGFGTQKKETVVGSVAQVSGDKLRNMKMGGSIENALQGNLPGLVVLMQDATPGEEASSITMQIRGGASMGSNTPLILVDGVERSFSNMDPNEVASISILKDASATAVYGVKGANGVVIVTTKRGRSGQLQLDFTSETQIKQATRLPKYMRSYETMLLRNEAYRNDGLFSSIIPDAALEHYRTHDSPYLYPDFDWMDFYFKPAVDQNYNLNARGGNDFVQYFVSLGFLSEGDIFNVGDLFPYKYEKSNAHYWHRRYNFRNNLDFNLTKTTRLTVNLSGNLKVWNKPVDDYTQEMWFESVSTMPYYPADAIEKFPDPNNPFDKTGIRYYENPQQGEVRLHWLGARGFLRNKSNGVSTDVNLEQKLDFITKGLSASGFYSFNNNVAYRQSFDLAMMYSYYLNPADSIWRRYTNNQALAPDDPQPKLNVSNGDAFQSSSVSYYYKAQLNYNRRFGKHDVTGMGVFSRRKSQGSASFPSYEESWAARTTYAYADKYMFEGSLAYTGSEKFAPGLRFGLFPAFAVGWLTSEENFFKTAVPWMNYFKTKFSWGKVGSDAGISRWLYRSEFTQSGSTSFGYPSVSYPLINEGAIAVTDATWEAAIKKNLGFEMGFFKNVVTLNIDLYNEKREDILQVRRSVPSWVGIGSISANIGETKAHGMEIELGVNKTFFRKLTVQVRGTLGANESMVVKYDEPVALPAHLSVEGKPVGVARSMGLSGFIDGGFYQNFDELFMWPRASGFAPIVGDFKYVDYNGDGRVDASDKIVSKNPYTPTLTWSSNLAIIYKNFDARVDFYGISSTSYAMRQGGMFYLYPFSQNKDNAYTIHANHWTPENTNPIWPAVHSQATNQYNYQNNSFAIIDGRYTRLKNLSIGYKLNTSNMKFAGIKEVAVKLTGTNLITWTPMKLGGDPEGFNMGVDFGAYPMMKRYSFEVKLMF
jgi:TonB-linked SusC/RagA family outer membrane protein